MLIQYVCIVSFLRKYVFQPPHHLGESLFRELDLSGRLPVEAITGDVDTTPHRDNQLNLFSFLRMYVFQPPRHFVDSSWIFPDGGFQVEVDTVLHGMAL
jgi:hypothetical protein